jgi:hypothetical protein
MHPLLRERLADRRFLAYIREPHRHWHISVQSTIRQVCTRARRTWTRGSCFLFQSIHSRRSQGEEYVWLCGSWFLQPAQEKQLVERSSPARGLILKREERIACTHGGKQREIAEGSARL